MHVQCNSKSLLFVLCFLSGFCALVYEVIWARMFGFVLGTTMVAWAIVLAAYMGGIALGSFIGGRCADRSAHPLRLFAFCEAGIGLFAAGSWMIVLAEQHFLSFIGSYPIVPAGLTAFLRIACSGGLLIIPTILMGATFPLVSRIILANSRENGRDLGILYSVNTFGAVTGTVASGFVLLPALGMTSSLLQAAGVNIVVATVVLLFFFNRRNEIRIVTNDNLPEQARPSLPVASWTIPFILACSGFCAMAFEVLWSRSLVFFLTSTTYAFTAMLSVVLAGLACGGILSAMIARKTRDPRAWIVGLQLFIGIFACVTPLLLQYIDPFILFAEGCLGHSWPHWIIVRYAVCFGMIYPPALCMGATIPLCLGAALRSLGTTGRTIGNLIFVNTAGGIAGALFVTFLLVPVVGTTTSFVIIAAVNFAAGWVVLSRARTVSWKCSAPVAAIMAALLAFSLMFAGKNPIVLYSRVVCGAERPTTVISYKEDQAASVAVLKTDRERTLNIDGFNAAGTYRYEYMHLLGHLPVLLSASPDTALVICLGTGTTCGAIGLHPSVSWVDCAEISSAVIQSAPFFADVNNNIAGNPKIHILHDDGRNHLLRSRRTYDVITLEPMHPYLSSATNLYSSDFYKLCKKRLSAHGVMAQWAPLHVLSSFEYRMLIRSFTSVFPHSSLWFLGTEGILIGTMDSLHIDINELKSKMAIGGVSTDLAKISLYDPARLLSCFMMDEAALESFVKDVPAMTDNHPVIEFSAPRNLALPAERLWLANMEELVMRRSSVLPLLLKPGDSALREVVKSSVASSLIMKAQISIAKQDFFNALSLADSAVEILPNDTTARMVKHDARDRAMAVSLNIARMQRRQGNLLGAEQAYLQVLTADSTCTPVQTELTTLYTGLGLFEKGLEHAQKAVASSPSDPALLVNLAVVYMNLNRTAEAETELHKAIQVEDTNQRALNYLKELSEEKVKRSLAAQKYQ